MTQANSTRRAIVMLSIGERDWLPFSAATFERYARRVRADFHVEHRVPERSDFPIKELTPRPGRLAKMAYACKLYYAWKHLDAGYDQVLFVDDTCCIRPAAPDIFALVPAGHCGFTLTGSAHAEASFQTIQRFIAERNLPPIDYVADDYMNGGVILYDRAATAALQVDRICDAADLLYAAYPQQTLLYYLLKRGGIPLWQLPKTLNSILKPRQGRLKRFELEDALPHVSDEILVYHITAGYRHRAALISEIGALFLREWDLADRGA